jgi:uncharacterized membrane protein
MAVNHSALDIGRDEMNEAGGFYDFVSSLLLLISVFVWMCLWGALWFSSFMYVALHVGDEPPRLPRFNGRHEI